MNIDQIHITNSSKIFILSSNNAISTYIADNQKTDDFDNKLTYNKSALSTNIKINDKSVIIKNMYLINDCFLKSCQKTSNGNTSDNYLNVFQHKLLSNNCKFTTINNTIYGITDRDIYGHYVLSQDIYGYISCDTGHILPKDVEISTLLFDKNKIKAGILENCISGNISNVSYNKIIEIPGNIYNDYDSGNYTATTYCAKNNYSSKYSMEYDNDYILKNTRDYIGIGSFANNIYLKYYDNINYDYNLSSGNIDKTLKYQNIEVIGAMRRTNNLASHKSNLYSLNISGIKNYVNNSSLSVMYNSIQQQIKNIITTYLEHLAPANTQIFKININ